MQYVPLESYLIKRLVCVALAGLCLLIVMQYLQLPVTLKAGAAILMACGFLYLRNHVYPQRWAKITEELTRQARDKDEANFRDEVAQHVPVLARKRKMLVTTDDYGNEIRDKWAKEKLYYLSQLGYQSRVTPYYSGQRPLEMMRMLDEIIDDYLDDHVDDLHYRDEMTPTEYEHYCADLLREQGWEARVTPGSGDQGVDVLAEKQGITLAVQCKKYASPVGNKAVQEIVAGRGYYQASFGLVVSNNTYTIPARQLALSQHIFLLHHDELRDIDYFLGISNSHG